LRLKLEERDHFDCSMTTKSYLVEYSKVIKDSLNEEELRWIRNSQFGPLLDVASHYQCYAQIIWVMMLHQADVDTETEMWFVVNKKPIRFSLEEYMRITGLYSHDYPEDKDWVSITRENGKEFQEKHFRNKLIVASDDVSLWLQELESLADGLNKEKLKLAMLLYIGGILITGDNKRTSPIDLVFFGIASNLVRCNAFP